MPTTAPPTISPAPTIERDVEAGLEKGVAGKLAEDGLSRLTPVAGLEPSDPSTTAGGPRAACLVAQARADRCR